MAAWLIAVNDVHLLYSVYWTNKTLTTHCCTRLLLRNPSAQCQICGGCQQFTPTANNLRKTNCTDCKLRQSHAWFQPVATPNLQVGTDVDALAVKAALDNAELNSVGSRFTGIQCSSSIQVHTFRIGQQLWHVSCSFGVFSAAVVCLLREFVLSVCMLRHCTQSVGFRCVLKVQKLENRN